MIRGIKDGLQIESQCRKWRNWSRQQFSVRSQVSELLEHKMRERVSNGIIVARDVGGTEDIGS